MDKREEYQKNRQRYYRELFEASDGCCFNCQASDVEFHIHHIVPLSGGGTNNRFNLSLLCLECHGKVHQKDFLKMSELSKKSRLKKIEKPILPPDEELIPLLIEKMIHGYENRNEVKRELEKRFYISIKDRKRMNHALGFVQKTQFAFITPFTRKGERWEALLSGDYTKVIMMKPNHYIKSQIPLSLYGQS